VWGVRLVARCHRALPTIAVISERPRIYSANQDSYTGPLLLPFSSLVVLAREHKVPHLREYAC
jgi:hypothetical protein